MTNTSFYDDHGRIIKNSAYSYYSDDGVLYKKRILSSANVGPTNLLSTVEDLSLWTMNFNDPKVGNADIYKQMQTPAILNNGEPE